MNPTEAKQWILDALADLPSGPPGEEVLAVLLARAWEEGGRAAVGHHDTGYPIRNPYQKAPHGNH